MNNQALTAATIVGLVLQLAMVLGGHYTNAIKHLFAVGGMAFSLIAGLVFAGRARAGWPQDLAGGAIAGGLCAFIGIAVSVLLGDVPVAVLGFGAIASVVTGLIGGGVGRLIFG